MQLLVDYRTLNVVNYWSIVSNTLSFSTAFDKVITTMLKKYNQLHHSSVTVLTEQVYHIYEAILIHSVIVRFREPPCIVTEFDFD